MRTRATTFLKGLTGLFGAILIAPAAIAQCGLQTPPVEQSFDNNTMPPGCWTNQQGWELGQQGDPAYGAESAADHTNNGGYFAWVDFSNESNARFASDTIDVSGMTNQPEVVYWFFSNNTNTPGDNNTLELQAWDGSSWQVVKSHAQDDPDWVRDTAILTSAHIFNDSIRIRFRAHETTSSYAYHNDILIDDIQIRELPSCYEPSNLNVTDIGSDSAVLEWSSHNGSGNNWDIEYGTQGFSQGNGTVVNSTDTSYNLTGLTPETTYDFYVREWCSSTDTSVWTGPFTFTTDCGIASVPFYEDFNGSSFSPGGPGSIDVCWTRTPDTDGDYIWKAENGSTGSPSTGPDDDHPGGGEYMYTEASDGSTGDHATLTSPEIDMSSLSLPRLKFYYHFYGANIDTFFVSMDNGSGWSDLDTIVGEQHSSEGAAWTLYDKNLLNSVGDTAQFRFEGVQGSGFTSDYSIDSVSVIEGPSCLPPSDLGVTNVGPDSAVLNWSTFPNFNGTNNTWKVEYGPSGFTQGNGTTQSVTDSSLQVDSLTAGTDYDFYVKEYCSSTDSSEWSEPFTFTTTCAYYSAPYAETFDDDVIPNCWNEIISSGSGWEYGQQGDPGYGASSASEHTGNGGHFAWVDFSSQEDNASLISPKILVDNLNTPELSFWMYSNNTDHPGEFNSLKVSAWNGNSWETIDVIEEGSSDWIHKRYYVGDKTFGDTVQIRIKADENSNMNAGSPHHNDLLMDDFEIREAPSVNMAGSDVVFPTGTHCELEDAQVEARFVNKGSNAVDSFQVGYIVNGLAPVFDTINSTLQTGEDTIHRFAPTSTMDYPGSYDLEIFSIYGQDTITHDDTAYADVTVDGSAERPEPDLGADDTLCWDEELTLDPGHDSAWSYLWDDNTTEQERSIVAEFLDSNSTYTYEVTVTNTETASNCSASDQIDITVKNCKSTGIEDPEAEAMDFTIRPNPASERIIIESSGVEGGFHYELLDLQGRTVQSQRSGAEQRSTLNVSQLSDGVYILKGSRDSNDEMLFQKKVVVE